MTAALLGCTALVAFPLAATAQDGTGGEPYRLGTIFVDAGAEADDDANSTIAKELWTGGKVATSVLDTPASVSVITQKEFEERNVDKVEDLLEYTPASSPIISGPTIAMTTTSCAVSKPPPIATA